MRKLHIMVDCDVVLNNLLENWIHFINRKHGSNIDANDVRTWDLGCVCPELTEEEVYQPFSEDEFWKTLKTVPYSREYLEKMFDDGHEISIVTAASVYETIPAKIDWLLANYPFLYWEDVIITHKKQRLIGDVLIDDGPHNLVNGNYLKLLFDCTNNRDYDAEANGMIRVYNLSEAYDVIKNLR